MSDGLRLAFARPACPLAKMIACLASWDVPLLLGMPILSYAFGLQCVCRSCSWGEGEFITRGAKDRDRATPLLKTEAVRLKLRPCKVCYRMWSSAI